MSSLKAKGHSNYDILMMNTSDETQELAVCFGERIAIKQCVEKLELLKESKEIVRDYFIIFVLEIVNRELGKFILNKWISLELAEEVQSLYTELIKKAAKNAEKIIMSLNIPVHAIKVPIANDYVKYNSYANQGELINAKL